MMLKLATLLMALTALAFPYVAVWASYRLPEGNGYSFIHIMVSLVAEVALIMATMYLAAQAAKEDTNGGRG